MIGRVAAAAVAAAIVAGRVGDLTGCGLDVTPDTIGPADTGTVTLAVDPDRIARGAAVTVAVVDRTGHRTDLPSGTVPDGGTETIAAADLTRIAQGAAGGGGPLTVEFTAVDPTGRQPLCTATVTVADGGPEPPGADRTDGVRRGEDTPMAVLLGGGTVAVALGFRRRALRPRKPTPVAAGR